MREKTEKLGFFSLVCRTGGYVRQIILQVPFLLLCLHFFLQ